MVINAQKKCFWFGVSQFCSSTTSTLQRHDRWTMFRSFPYESTTLSPRLALLNPQRGVSVFALEVDSPSVVVPKRPTNPLTAIRYSISFRQVTSTAHVAFCFAGMSWCKLASR